MFHDKSSPPNGTSPPVNLYRLHSVSFFVHVPSTFFISSCLHLVPSRIRHLSPCISQMSRMSELQERMVIIIQVNAVVFRASILICLVLDLGTSGSLSALVKLCSSSVDLVILKPHVVHQLLHPDNIVLYYVCYSRMFQLFLQLLKRVILFTFTSTLDPMISSRVSAKPWKLTHDGSWAVGQRST